MPDTLTGNVQVAFFFWVACVALIAIVKARW